VSEEKVVKLSNIGINKTNEILQDIIEKSDNKNIDITAFNEVFNNLRVGYYNYILFVAKNSDGLTINDTTENIELDFYMKIKDMKIIFTRFILPKNKKERVRILLGYHDEILAADDIMNSSESMQVLVGYFIQTLIALLKDIKENCK
jgi:hypothetical protein